MFSFANIDPAIWGFFGSVATGFSAVAVAGISAYRKFDKRTSAVEENTSKMADATRQLRPNGGSHLYDAIHRIEADGLDRARVLERLDEKQDAQCELIANLTGRFEQHLNEAESQRREWVEWLRSPERSFPDHHQGPSRRQ
jgi:hypothetical protein